MTIVILIIVIEFNFCLWLFPDFFYWNHFQMSWIYPLLYLMMLQYTLLFSNFGWAISASLAQMNVCWFSFCFCCILIGLILWLKYIHQTLKKNCVKVCLVVQDFIWNAVCVYNYSMGHVIMQQSKKLFLI